MKPSFYAEACASRPGTYRPAMRNHAMRSFPLLAVIVAILHVFVTLSPMAQVSTLHLIPSLQQLQARQRHTIHHPRPDIFPNYFSKTTLSTVVKHPPPRRSLLSGLAKAISSTFPASLSRKRRPLHLRIPNNPEPDVVESTVNALMQTSEAQRLMSNPLVDTPYILYRALGNDLPPRHAVGQTLTNVRFILDNEPSHAGLSTRWYLNRILDPTALLPLLELLISRNQTFVIDSLNLTQFHTLDFDFSQPPNAPSLSTAHGDVLRSALFSTRKRYVDKRIAFNHVLAPKSHALVHNNQARNSMLRMGIAAGATYILPWDGNCFLSATAWKHISSSIAEASRTAIYNSPAARYSTSPDVFRDHSLRYFYTPMQRMTSNTPLLSANNSHDSPPLIMAPPDASEEPQLIFHREAVERFDEHLAYGCGPKVDLLYRLQIRGPWTEKASLSASCFLAANRPLSRDVPGNASVLKVGWTARLFSGVVKLERVGALRGAARAEGVELAVARATLRAAARVGAFPYGRTLLYNADVLAHNVGVYARREDAELDGIVENMLRQARKEMTTANRRGGGRAAALQALAGLFSGDRKHHALARSMIQSATTYAGLNSVPAPDAAKAGDVCAMLDAVHVLHLTGGLPYSEERHVHGWVSVSIEAMRKDSPVESAGYFDSGLEGVQTELMRTCLCAYARDDVCLVRATGLSKGRLFVQMDAAGLRDDAGDGRGLVRRMEGWTALATAAERTGENMWTFGLAPADGGKSFLAKGLRHMAHAGGTVNATDTEDGDVDRVVACGVARALFERRLLSQREWTGKGVDDGCWRRLPGLATGTHELPPYWNLGMSHDGAFFHRSS